MARVPEPSEGDGAWVIIPTRTTSHRGRRRLAPAKQKRGRGEYEQIGNVHPGDDLEVARELVKLHFEITKLRRRIDNRIAQIPVAAEPPEYDGTGIPVWVDGLRYADMPGLYAWYRLGEAAAATTYEDSSTNNRDLTTTGSGTALGTGTGNDDVMGDNDDGAIDFSGAAHTLFAGTRPKYPKSAAVYDSAYTRATPRLMMAWVNPDVAFTYDPVAASPTDNNFFPILAITNGEVGVNGANNKHAILGWNSSTKKLVFLHSDTTDIGGLPISSTSYPASTATVERDAWTHVAWLFDPATDQSFLFINAEQDSVHADTSSAANLTGTACWLEVGSCQWAHGALASGFGYDYFRGWQGQIDEAVICSGELFDAQDIYNFAYVNGADGGSWVIIPVADAIPDGAISEDQLDFDPATQTELDAHVNDTTAAHAASAISYAGGTGISSTDVEAAIDEVATEKADLASPALTGNPTAPTQAGGNSSTRIATTAFVAGELTSYTTTAGLTSALALKADLASPTFTGNPTAPTQTAGNNTTRLATTAFVTGAVTDHVGLADPHTQYALDTDLAAYAPLASPVFTGNPTAPTATVGDNDTSIATTAFVTAAVAAGGGGGGGDPALTFFLGV